MNRVLFSLFLFLLVAPISQVSARMLEAEGFGGTLKSSQIAAVSTLANSIYVNVESKSSLYQDGKGEKDFSFQASLTTNIPVLGVKYHCNKTEKEYLCKASLNTATALPIYKVELANVVTDIDKRYATLSSLNQKEKLDTLTDILTKLTQYERLSFIVRFLSGQMLSLPAPAVNMQQISTKILELENSVQSIDVAARLITRQISERNIYVVPVTPANSREVTPFSSVLAEKIKSHLTFVNDKKRAKFILEGRYIENKVGIRVYYNLSDRQGNTVKSMVIKLLPKCYQQYRTKPLAPDFDQLLHNGYAVSSELEANIVTNKGMRNLLFKEGEEIELLMKVNLPGYYYIVGHIKNMQVEQSYLIELNGSADDRRFIGYISIDDINKWVPLGEFVVDKPFGLESLQLIASTHDLIGRLPNYQYSSLSGYYVLSNKIEEGVKMIRDIKKVASNTSESVLLFTTQSK